MKRILLVVLFAAFGITTAMAGSKSCCAGQASECKSKKDASACTEHASKMDKGCTMHGVKQAKVDPKVGTCPVSGEPASKKVSTVYDGTTYHFCCKDCVKTFTANPTKYTSKSKL